MSDFRKSLAAGLSGAVEGPLDIARIAGKAWNSASNLPPEMIATRNAGLDQFYNNPPFFSDNINAFRNSLKQEFPKAHLAGEFGAGGLFAMLRKKVPEMFISKNPHLRLKQSLAALGVGTAAAAAQEPAELIVENVLDKPYSK